MGCKLVTIKSKNWSIVNESTVPDKKIILRAKSFRKSINENLESSSKREEVLLFLDLILDYLTFEELTQMFSVNKFFCYVATMERLYVKFNILATESHITESLWSSKVSSMYATIKVLNKSISSSKRDTISNWMISSFHKQLLTKNSLISCNESFHDKKIRSSKKMSSQTKTILNRSKTFLNVSAESQFRKASFNHSNTNRQ